MQLVPDFKYTFLDMWRSTNAGHFAHSALELRPVGSQLEAHLRADLVKQFPKITMSWSTQLARYKVGAHDNVVDDSSSKPLR
jgi:hypothetical protein